MGWRDVGCFGGDLFETPNIDRLATEGMRFTQAYANCPVCSPSRAALMTGKNPARLGFTGHITAIGRHRHPENSKLIPPDGLTNLPHDEETLAEVLGKQGYVSASIGKWHLGEEGYWPEQHGFDVNVAGWTHGSPPHYFYPYTRENSDWNGSIPTMTGGEEGEYLTDRLTDETIGFMEANRDNPFFVYLTHYGVHTPLQAPKPLVEKYKKELKGKEKQVHPTYAAMVENMDWNVGRVLQSIEDLGLSEDTVVVFTSDNGGLESSASQAPLRKGKGTLYEGGIRIPQIIKWPGKIPAGSLSEAPTIGTDLFATLAEIGGGSVRDDIDGKSFSALWDGGEYSPRESLVWYYPHYHSQSMRPGAAIRKGDYKLIEYYDPEGVELYNLAADLSEKRNLASEMPEKAEELLADLNGYLDAVDTIRPTPNPNAS